MFEMLFPWALPRKNVTFVLYIRATCPTYLILLYFGDQCPFYGSLLASKYEPQHTAVWQLMSVSAVLATTSQLHCHTHTLTRTHTHSLTLSLSLSHTHTHTHSHAHSYTQNFISLYLILKFMDNTTQGGVTCSKWRQGSASGYLPKIPDVSEEPVSTF